MRYGDRAEKKISLAHLRKEIQKTASEEALYPEEDIDNDLFKQEEIMD